MKLLTLSIAIFGSVAFATTSTFAKPSGGAFEIVKSTIDGGGTSSGGDFILKGTVGQPDGNRDLSYGEDFILAGGFWAKVNSIIFGDGFEGG